MTEEEWHAQNLAVQRQAVEERLAREREWVLGMEKKLRAKFAAQAAAAQKKAPAPPASRGFGWSVLEHPRVSHATLEERVQAIWRFCWHHADWPGWRVRWGALDSDLLTIGAAIAGAARAHHCAVSLFGRAALGLAVMNEKIVLLDEKNQQGRPDRDVVQTIVHELCHINVSTTVHGAQFQAALKSAMDYYDRTPGAPALVLAQPARPTPRVGVRYPFPDSQIEYRG